MGLKLTLKKEDNSLFNDFIDAYWKISRLYYTPTVACFELSCYPSRDASKMELVPMTTPSLPIGGANKIAYETSLYVWQCQEAIASLFPNGIPLSEDDQKTAIYNWIKDYTKLPFEDVYEEEE